MPSDKLKVFISWSGLLAKQVAVVWYDLVKLVIDGVEPFMSEENIGAGQRGLDKIAAELSGSRFGIIVVTQDNQGSEWLNYEAGALSKFVGDAPAVRVAPSLVDFDRKNDVKGPLGQFQASLLDKEGVRFIVREIARVVDDADEASVLQRLEYAWPEYAARFAAAKGLGAKEPSEAHRKPDDMLDEILTLVRDLARVANARIDSNTPAMVREFGPSYGTLSREYVSGMVMAVLKGCPDKAGGVVSVNLVHLPDGKPGAVVETSFEIPSLFQDRIRETLAEMNIGQVAFEKMNIVQQ